MLDFTKNVHLTPKWQKRYLILRFGVYVFFLLVSLVALNSIIFPSFSVDHFFSLKNTKKNTLAIPPRDKQNQPLKNDKLQEGGNFQFDASRLGKFSTAQLSFTLKKDSAQIKNAHVSAQKAYAALFYPQGDSIGFKDGSLLNKNMEFFLVSDGVLHKFASAELMQKLGFLPDMFTEVNAQDLLDTPLGAPLEKATYPNQTLFAIEDAFYQLKNGTLHQFISSQAFLSHYDKKQALAKNADFLTQFPVSEDLIGFADGTLVSSPQSVFVLSENKSFPIDSTFTFEALGYNWNDVITASSDEIGLYEKQKVLDINAIHPSGTVFYDKDTQKYFIFKDQQIHPLTSALVAASYLKKNPVFFAKQEINLAPTCQLSEKIWPLHTYACTLDIKSLENLAGSNYHFEISLGDEINLQNLHLTLKKSLGRENFNDSLVHIKQLLMQNYAPQN